MFALPVGQLGEIVAPDSLWLQCHGRAAQFRAEGLPETAFNCLELLLAASSCFELLSTASNALQPHSSCRRASWEPTLSVGPPFSFEGSKRAPKQKLSCELDGPSSKRDGRAK